MQKVLTNQSPTQRQTPKEVTLKSDTNVKYPNAANLFTFCRKILDHKYGGVRVIDQDVGQILGFDPADCSHWKKGKKNIRSIQAMKSIAEHLGVDERLVVDVATGELTVPEAYYEFSGYGAFEVESKIIEAAKKEFYKKNSGSWSTNIEATFKKYFLIDTENIERRVNEIHERINFEEAPLYLPEIVTHYPNFVLKSESSASPSPKVEKYEENGKFHIAYDASLELRPYIRYQIAKAMASHFLAKAPLDSSKLQEYRDHIHDVESNIFAARLLAPTRLIRKEIRQLDASKDIATQLSDSFWVSKAFINRRLKEILTSI